MEEEKWCKRVSHLAGAYGKVRDAQGLVRNEEVVAGDIEAMCSEPQAPARLSRRLGL